MSAETVRRTRKLMMERHEVVDRMAFNFWRNEHGTASGIADAATWAAMPEEERAALRVETWRRCEEHWASPEMPSEWQREAARQSLVRLLDRNAALADALPDHVSPETPEGR